MDKCLMCYRPVADADGEMHEHCRHRFFHADIDARLPFSLSDIEEMVKEHVLAHTTVPGVQKKLSLHLQKNQGRARRLTVTGYREAYILKPPTDDYPELPELEDATMHMAEACGISVVPHGLIRFRSGERAYITRRLDRTRAGAKVHMEDLCQVSGRLTEHKYRGSVEHAGKMIWRHSAAPGLDRINFFELLIFCFIPGNADMHLKNFSLLHTGEGPRLAPAYDLLPTKLLLPEDEEESALTVDGRKKRLTRAAYLRAADTLDVPSAAAEKAIDAILHAMPVAVEVLRSSFVSGEMIARYEDVIDMRMAQLKK
jgi:serine/threonine-protein kinase HipA